MQTQTQNKPQKTFLGSLGQMLFLLTVVFLIRTLGFGLYQVPTGSMETTMLVGERFFADKLTYLFRAPQRNEIIAFNDPLFNYSPNTLTYLFQQYVWGPSNWTKRVIGVPGDHVRGVVEDGKPVVYLNDVKLDEPYINKYPLIDIWKTSPESAQKAVEQEALKWISQGYLNSNQFNEFVAHQLRYDYQVRRSYDPALSYEAQPFYRITPDRIVYHNGNPILVKPFVADTKPQTVRAPKPGNKSTWNGTDEFDVYLGENQYWCMGDNRRSSQDCRFFGPIDGKYIHARILFRIWSVDSNEDWWIVDLIKHPVDFFKRVRWNRFLQLVR